MSVTVSELIKDVRDQLDELNEASITDMFLLQALNRAQKPLVRMMAKNEDTMLLEMAVISLDSGTVAEDGTREYDMPEGTMARRIEKVETRIAGQESVRVLKPITYKQRESVRYRTGTTRPAFYDIRRDKIRVYPQSTSTYELIVFFSRQPEPLVLPQGRINKFNFDNNYVIVDELGDSLTSEADQRESFVNIIDYQTGLIKASLQVAFIDTGLNQIKFKSSGLTRSKVFTQNISTALPSDITEDDLICFVRGTCVPQYPEVYTDYLVQSAVVKAKHKLREDTAEDYAALRDIEKDIQQMALGRDPSFKVKHTSSVWTSQRYVTRRY